jgi:hypothetical protein
MPFLQRLNLRKIHTEIEINAAPQAVWAVLAHLQSYPEWNPFITSARTELKPGARLEITVRVPGGPTRTFRPRIVRVEPGRELRWLGTLLVPGLCDGEHLFRIEPTRAGSRFVNAENFTGLLVPFVNGVIESTAPGYALMNEALKARVEGIRRG